MPIKDLNKVKKHLFLCNGDTCTQKGAADNTLKIREYILQKGLHDEIHTTKTYCNGRCKDGPIMIVMPEGNWYGHVDPAFSNRYVQQELIHGIEMTDNRLFQYGGVVEDKNCK